MENEVKQATKIKYSPEFIVQIVLIAVLSLLVAFNAGRIYSVGGDSSGGIGGAVTGVAAVSASEIMPSGMPEVYGKELGVSYDDILASNTRLADTAITKLAKYEGKELTDGQMSRYIKIAGSISCEYCCGSEAIIFSNGERACGCAHSYAMRGLAKYLIVNHSDMSDYEILSELGKWKVLFFPGIHEKKAEVLKANGIDYTNYVNLASNLYRGAENQASASSSEGSQMVGGC